MGLNLIAWNSQGDKADALWRALVGTSRAAPFQQYLPAPLGTAPAGTSLLIFVCEAGNPPWYNSKADVAPGHVYRFSYGNDTKPLWFNQDSLNSGIGQALAAHTKDRILADAIWIEWQRPTIPGGPVYSRCSVSAYWFPDLGGSVSATLGKRDLVHVGGESGRPVITANFRAGGADKLSLYLTHLPAYTIGATEALRQLVAATAGIQPETAPPVFIGGDLNIDALAKPAPTVPKRWSAARTGKPTQWWGGELDWGIVKGASPSVTRLWPYTTSVAPPASDHSGLLYQFALAKRT